MNINLEYYRIFYYVAKYQNFTRAARALGNGQPNITRAINLLEQEIRWNSFSLRRKNCRPAADWSMAAFPLERARRR